MARRKVFEFVDTWVFYHDGDSDRWVAHSLNTDQVGMGPSVFKAYVVLAKVIRSLLSEYRQNPKIRLLRLAPKEILDLVKNARPLPKEIAEVAEMKLRGDRPRHTPRPPYNGRARWLKTAVTLAEPVTA